MTDELDRFVDRVQARTGHPDRDHVHEAVGATLRTLGSHLGGVPPALHDVIPRPMHPDLTAGEGGEHLRPAELYPRLSEQLDLRVGVVLELVQSTVVELGAVLAEPSRKQLRGLLPPAWAALVIDPDPRAAPSAASARPASGQTLASGRPGGSRPLSQAVPMAGQNDSIAASDDPHPDRLAEAQGPGPKDEDRTLAKGRPGSRHPLSDSE